MADKHSLGMAFPNLPYFRDRRGRCMTQHLQILRAIGEDHGLAGATPEERAVAQMTVEAARDWMTAFTGVTYCSADADAEPGLHVGDFCAPTSPKFERLRAEYSAGALETHCAAFASALERAGSGWIAGGGAPTYADFYVAELLDQHRGFAAWEPRFPALDAYTRRVLGLPGVAEYRADAAFRAEPLHNRYSHYHRGWRTG